MLLPVALKQPIGQAYVLISPFLLLFREQAQRI
jgi:hypothetical protein